MSWTTHRWNNGETSIRWNPEDEEGWAFPSPEDILGAIAESRAETGIRPTMLDVTALGQCSIFGLQVLTELVEFS